MTKDELMSIRYTRLIEDPFPEHTAYQMTMQMLDEMRSPLERLLRIKFSDHHIPKPESVSIHAAWRMGYEKAYSEIEQHLAAQANSDQERKK